MHRMMGLFVCGLVTALSVARAESSPSRMSEFNHQPAAGVFEFTGGLTITKSRWERNDNGAELRKSINNLSAELQYGLNENVAIGISVPFISGSGERTNCPAGLDCSLKQNGFSDFEFEAQGRYGLGPGHLITAATLSVSPKDSEIDADGDSNAFSGGHTFNVRAGYEGLIGNYILGAEVSYDLYKGDRSVKEKSTPEVNYDIEGGRELQATAYLERRLEKWNLGGALSVFRRKIREIASRVQCSPIRIA